MDLNELLLKKATQERPTIVCLCGSTRFSSTWRAARLRETLEGKIVLTIGNDLKPDSDLEDEGLPIDREALSLLHLWKIDLCDEVLILNVYGYIGPSTECELRYAIRQGKKIRWWQPNKVEEYNREMDERNRLIVETRTTPWLPFHDGE